MTKNSNHAITKIDYIKSTEGLQGRKKKHYKCYVINNFVPINNCKQKVMQNEEDMQQIPY